MTKRHLLDSPACPKKEKPYPMRIDLVPPFGCFLNSVGIAVSLCFQCMLFCHYGLFILQCYCIGSVPTYSIFQNNVPCHNNRTETLDKRYTYTMDYEVTPTQEPPKCTNLPLFFSTRQLSATSLPHHDGHRAKCSQYSTKILEFH